MHIYQCKTLYHHCQHLELYATDDLAIDPIILSTIQLSRQKQNPNTHLHNSSPNASILRFTNISDALLRLGILNKLRRELL